MPSGAAVPKAVIMGEEVGLSRLGILPLWTSVRERRIEPELMDRQDLDPRLREQALVGLRRINLVSLSSRLVWRPIRAFARAARRPVRVLDLASGGGDVALDLARFAKHDGLPVTVHGCDLSPEAVEYANRRAKESGIDSTFFVHDVLGDPLPRGYDVIVNTLFMHHFDDGAAARVLQAICSAQPNLIVVSDLVRGARGFLLAHLACHALTRSYIVHYDGPRSVAAAYTVKEFAKLAEHAGLNGHRIRTTWPFRFLFTWEAQ